MDFMLTMQTLVLEFMQAELGSVVHLLVSGLQGGQGRGDEQQQLLNQYAENPAFCRCLSYIFQCEQAPNPQIVPPTIAWSHVREIAALVLKNNIERHHVALGREAVQYAGVTASAALMSQELKLRKAAAQVIAIVTRVCGLEIWAQSSPPIDLLNELWQMASQGNRTAFVALRYLFEDASDKIGEHTTNILLLLCDACQGSFEALECVVAAYEIGADLEWPENPQMQSHFQQGIWGRSENVAKTLTSMLGHETPPVVRKGLLKLMALMLDYRFAFELPSNVAAEWMQCAVYHTREPVYFVEACTYIATVGSFAAQLEDISDMQDDTFIMSLAPAHALEILPILLSRMTYGEDEVIEIMEKDDISIRDLNVLPPQTNRRGADSKDLDDEEVDQMTMRSVSTRCLEAISLVHPNVVYAELRSILQSRVSDSDWKIRETGIMAIGAIIHGCYKAMKPHLSQVLSLVLDRAMGDANVLVRSTACWTVGKAFSFIATDGQAILPRAFEVLIACCLANSKRLQWAAITSIQVAFSYCAALDPRLVEPAVPMIMRVMGDLAEKFQANNLLHLLNLFDTIVAKWPDSTKLDGSRAFLQVLFARIDGARSELHSNPRSVAVREMLYILSPIANLFQSKLQLDASARQQLVQNCFVCIKFYFSQGNEESDFVTYPLHLLAVMFEVFPEDKDCVPYDVHASTLRYVFQAGDHNIMLEALLYLSSLSSQPSQAFVLDFMSTYGPLLMQLCNGVDVTCDAIWCMGQCCINMKHVIPPNPIIAFVGSLIDRVIQTQPDDYVRSILETCALTATRCIFYIPDLAVSLGTNDSTYIGHLAVIMRTLPNDAHKAEAVRGVFVVVRGMSMESVRTILNTILLLALSFHESITKYEELQKTVSECFRELQGGPLSGAFEAEFGKLAHVRQKMQQMYRF